MINRTAQSVPDTHGHGSIQNTCRQFKMVFTKFKIVFKYTRYV